VNFTHVLEHVSWRLAVPVFKNVASLTAPGGFFLVCVPSMEYACREVIRGQYDLGVVGMIFGGQDDDYAYHHSGYTHAALEMMVQQVNFQVYSFKETQIGVVIDGKPFAGKQWELMLRNPADPVVVETPEPVVVTKRSRRKRNAKK
jgi:predicted SAM-dependent methyltransferase